MKQALESSVENYLVDVVEKKLGGIALKGAVQGRRFIDRILILPQGVTIWCECKRPGKSSYGFTPHQIETLDRLDNLEHLTWKVKSKDEIDTLAMLIGQCRRNEVPPAELRSRLLSFVTSSSQRALSATSQPRRR